MDRDVGRWVLGFLSRMVSEKKTKKKTKTKTNTNTVMKIGRSIPLSLSDPNFLKAALFAFLRQALSTLSITEDTLRNLEVFEELHHRSGFPISPALPAAYCAIAVECTLKYLDLEPSPSNNPAYINAVDRIWRRRLRQIQSGSILFSEELNRWSSDIEASFQDPEVRERFVTMNSRRYAIQKLRLLLDEAQKDLSPSFVELAASMTSAPHTTTASTAHLQTVKMKDMSREPPIENQMVDAPVENQCADAPIENTDAPIENQSTDAPIEDGSNAAAPVEDQSEGAPAAEDQIPCDPIENVDHAKTKKTAACPSRVHHPSLTERNNTARRAEEWGKSTDGLEEEISSNASRAQLPTPKRSRTTPLKAYEPPKIVRRRKAKKWSALEEDTLRAAVNKIGEGNWKLILDSHKDVFAERTQVDLKDKWRNLTRYGAK